MSLYHDSYLFQPDGYAADVMAYVEALLQSDDAYSTLRSAALSVCDDNARVRQLLSEYGGWDRESIVTQIPDQQPQTPEDIAFWFVVLLYAHLQSDVHQLGLGNGWRNLDVFLKSLGWSDETSALLIYGHRVGDLITARLQQSGVSYEAVSERLQYLDYIQPFSTGARAGWIDVREVRLLLSKLREDEAKLAQRQSPDDTLFKQAYQSAITMLEAAQAAGDGLCLIISG